MIITSSTLGHSLHPIRISVIITPRLYMSVSNVIIPFFKNSGAKYPLHELHDVIREIISKQYETKAG